MCDDDIDDVENVRNALLMAAGNAKTLVSDFAVLIQRESQIKAC